jgi:phosphatidate phosphatase APP1
VAALYRAFQGGIGGAEANPIFYVSGSPWNLHDLIAEVFEIHGIPEGPIRLRDFGTSREALFWKDTAEHKLDEIRAIFDRYPSLPFVLVGDSGEKDPEVYRTIVGEYPERVLAVYIRNVTSAGRERAIERLAAEVRAAGSELVLARDSRLAAEHAASRGLIATGALGPVEESAARDRASVPVD